MDPGNFSFRSLIQSTDDMLEHRHLKKGELIVREGDLVKEIFYVEEGEVEINRNFDESDSEGSDGELEQVQSSHKRTITRMMDKGTITIGRLTR